jgi:SNF2 family DNA or RNA helicase
LKSADALSAVNITMTAHKEGLSLKPLWSGFSYFPHQLDGIHWMMERERTGVPCDGKIIRGGLQCDDMGLGKTIQVAAVIVNHVQPHTLLFAPLAMIDTWTGVLQRSGCVVYQVGEKKTWERVPSTWSIAPHWFNRERPAVFVTNYEKLYASGSLFSGYTWNRIVLDEAHKIRNGKSRMSTAARAVPAAYRWAVTGTPLVNSLKDVVALLAFLGVPCDKQFRWEPRFLAWLPSLLLHRSLDSLRSVIAGAPPVPVVHDVVLPFSSEEEEEFYLGVQGIVSESLAGKYKKDVPPAEMFKLLLRLRQISVHPQIYIDAMRRESASYDRPDWVAGSTKLDALHTIIQEDDHENHSYIVFCQFHQEMDLIRQSLLHRGVCDAQHVLMYHGGMSQMERASVLEKSKTLSGRVVLLLQLQAGGVGLNLQEYDRIVFVSPWWTSAMMDQAVARAVRMGQREVVHVYHLALSAEKEGAIQIDRLIQHKAHAKRLLLQKLLTICHEKYTHL